jgi:hypothetical protein
MDAAAIIAASTRVDLPFVMSLQAFRLMMLLLIGPPIARWVAGTLDRVPPQPEPSHPPDLGDLD